MATDTDRVLLDEVKQEYQYGFSDPEKYAFKSGRGLSHQVIDTMSDFKNEPDWMRQFRHQSLDIFLSKPMPAWGANLSDIDFDNIYYYVRPAEKQGKSWDDVPADIRNTFDRLGIPEAERKFLAGVGAQYECLTGDARVQTANGLKPIADIEAGETVFSFDETRNAIIPAQVTGKAAKGERPVFEVCVGTRTIKATANHPFLALTTQHEPGQPGGRPARQWTYLQDLRPGDLVAVVERLPEPGEFGGMRQPAINRQTAASRQGLELAPMRQMELAHASEATGQALGESAWQWLYARPGAPELAFLADAPQGRAASSLQAAGLRLHAGGQIGFARIDAITPAGTAQVYDIEVAGPHNFVAEGLIVHNSEVVYHSLREEWQKMGVVFLDTDSGLREYEDLFKEYFGTIIPPSDNKFAALNSAVWSGGSFVYVPKGVKLDIPLQAYFRINAQNMGQFERTLIIVEEGASVHYVEGCTAPIYSSDSLHSAVVEIIVKKGARCRYTTIQNWSNNVYNLVTKRAVAHEDATMEWIDGNLGCLAEGSTLTTPQGLKTIETLEVGDEVLSYDDQRGELVFRRVAGKRFSGYQPVHMVHAGERRLHVTANHPFYSYVFDPTAAGEADRHKLAYVRADHLQEAIVPVASLPYGRPRRLQMPALTTPLESSGAWAAELAQERDSHLAAPDVTNDDLMWLFGYWIGDGSVEVEPAPVAETMRWPAPGRAGQPAAGATSQPAPGVAMAGMIAQHLSWNSGELAAFLDVNGFTGQAENKRVPAWVWSLPESQRLAFVAGYLDASGHLQAPHSFALKSPNRALLEDVASLLVTLGVTSHLHAEFEEPRRMVLQGSQCAAAGACLLTFPLDGRLFAHIGPRLRQAAEASQPSEYQTPPAPFKLAGRGARRSHITLPSSVALVNIEVSEATPYGVPTWDIEVEGTGNFVSQGFIVHNSKVTMKYPAVYMVGPRAHGEILSIAFAGKGQHQDAGGKVVHGAPDTSSQIISKSISKNGGRASYRGLLKVAKGAVRAKSNVVCDALLLDAESRSDTYPYIEIDEDDVKVGHEASVSKIGEEQLFYLMSRGLTEDEASAMIVAGFIEPMVKELPMEYAVEMNRLIQLQMEGSIG